MKRLSVVALFLTIAFGVSGEDLSAVLARMDQSAATFHSMTANLTMATYTAILDDTTTEQGDLKMVKEKNGTEAIINFTGAKEARSIGFFNKQIQLYTPKLNLIQVYKLGKNAKFLDQYLLLGFGTSGSDLQKGYDIQLAGTEPIQGQSTSKLVLSPKQAAVKEQLSKVEIWIPATSGYPVQQKFYNPSGNYRLVTYTNFQLNPQLGSLKLNAPPNTKVEYPQ
jgi:outer membrane lipoprotein-sorting protein